MFEKINRNRNAIFKKKEYTQIIKNTVAYCTLLFGYTKKPTIVESSYDPKALMATHYLSKKHCYIVHNYYNFRKIFGEGDFTDQAAWAMFLAAHEMRHYYQSRQIDSKNPVEDEDILNEWRDNDKIDPPDPEESILNYFLQPRELDAELFAYIFVAEHMGVLVCFDAIDDTYINHLEEYYIRYFSETNEELFPKEDIRE